MHTSKSAKLAAYNDWVDELLALLGDAAARSGPRPKAMAAALAMMDPTTATKPPADHGWQAIIAKVADPARFRPAATKADKP